MKTTVIAIALALVASALNAQEQPQREGRPPREGGQPGGPGGDHHRPVPPLIAALDANHDGVIDEQEIANAPVALKKLDKNGDGKLTMDELMPPHPEGDSRRPGGDQGRRPPGGGDRPGRPRPEGGKEQSTRQRPAVEP